MTAVLEARDLVRDYHVPGGLFKASKTVHAVLSSLIQADHMSEQVRLSNLSYRKVIIHVGPVPSIRLCWRAEEVYEEEAGPGLPAASASAPTAGLSTTKSFLGESSFFGQRYAKKEPPAAEASPPAAASPGAETAPTEPATTSQGDWKKDVLAKFKVMPGASKYRK